MSLWQKNSHKDAKALRSNKEKSSWSFVSSCLCGKLKTARFCVITNCSHLLLNRPLKSKILLHEVAKGNHNNHVENLCDGRVEAPYIHHNL